MSHHHLFCLLSIAYLAVGASSDDDKCADCDICAPCLGCVALPAPYNEGLSREGVLALVGIGSDSSGGVALLKRLFGNDFELSMRNAPECAECTDCLPCIDCCEYLERGLELISFEAHSPCMLSHPFCFAYFTLRPHPNPVVGSESEECAPCEECSSSSCLGCIALSEPYSEGIGSGELFKLVMGLMPTANTTAGTR